MSASAPAVNQSPWSGTSPPTRSSSSSTKTARSASYGSRSTTSKDQPMFIDVATFGAQADACAKYLTKGRAVAVTGRLVYREWDDNGTRRSRHHIVGRVQFGGRPTTASSPHNDHDDEELTF